MKKTTRKERLTTQSLQMSFSELAAFLKEQGILIADNTILTVSAYKRRRGDTAEVELTIGEEDRLNITATTCTHEGTKQEGSCPEDEGWEDRYDRAQQ